MEQKTMDHNEAIRTQACEKYLLGELSGELRDAFEEHYFSCATCAAQLQAAATFAAASRQVFAEMPVHQAQPDNVRAPRGWFAWLNPLVAVPAFAILVMLTAYQNLVTIPHYRQAASPHVLPMYSLIAANTRSDEALTFSVTPDQPFGVYVDVPFSVSYPAYSLRLIDPAGSSTLLRSLSIAEAQKTQVVVIHPGKNAGRYTLVVSGLPSAGSGSEAELARLQFTVELRR
jgi:hypothetical protein